jgi:uncharacterized protein YndB with AHSA1/START domain
MRRLILLAALIAGPASAEVVQSSPSSFEISQTVILEAPLGRSWDALRTPARWWDKEHTYSGDSGNLTLDPVAGGCFCEKIEPGGSIEHAHIVYAQPPRMIRMVGSLGPLQAEAVVGTLTIRLDPDADHPKATKATISYVVGGFIRGGAEAMASKVDEVLATQLLGLKSAAESAPVKPRVEEGR